MKEFDTIMHNVITSLINKKHTENRLKYINTFTEIKKKRINITSKYRKKHNKGAPNINYDLSKNKINNLSGIKYDISRKLSNDNLQKLFTDFNTNYEANTINLE